VEPAATQQTFIAPDTGLRDYVHILVRRRWWLIGTFLLVVTLVALVTFTATPIYQARAKLLVEASRWGSARSGDVLGGLTGMSQARTIETQIEIMKSAMVMDPALKAVGLSSDGPKPGISVTPIKATDIIAVVAMSPDRSLAAKFANSLADEYVKMTLEHNRQIARQGRAFVETQCIEARDELAVAERSLKDFRQESGITAVGEAVSGLVERVQKQQEELGRSEATVAADKAEVAALRAKIGGGESFVVASKTLVRNPLIDQLRKGLAELEAERAEIGAEFAPTSKKVKSLQERIDKVRDQMASEADRVVSTEAQVNPIDAEVVRRHAIAEVKLLADTERCEAVRRTLRKTDVELGRLPEDQRRGAELHRNVSLLETRYLTLAQKLQELKLAEICEIPSARVIERAELPSSPVKPRKKRSMLLGVFMAVMLAVGVALVVNALDDTFATVQDIENQTGLSVLTVVYRQHRKARMLLSSPLGKSPFAEAFRMIRSGLRFSSVKHPISVLVMTSAAMGEGKSTLAANTAIACAEGGQRTILVDADLRRPSQHRILDVENTVGLTNCLVDDLDPGTVLHPTEYENLSLLSSGPVPPNPGELLDSEAMRQLLAKLREAADLVILDAPPGTILADTQILARSADAVLIVTDIASTKRPALRRLVDVLAREGNFIPGVVVNNARRGPGAAYYYGAHYYAEYYTEDVD